MALQMTKNTSFGIDAEYWRITNMNFDWHREIASAKLSGFVNIQARNEGKEPLMSYDFKFDESGFNFNIDGQLVEELYNKIKVLENWNSAIDV